MPEDLALALVDWLANIPFMFGPAECVALIVLLLLLPVVRPAPFARRWPCSRCACCWVASGASAAVRHGTGSWPVCTVAGPAWPPLLAGLATPPVLEKNLHRALLLSRGDWTTFATHPISAGLLLLTVLLAISGWWLRARLRRPANHPTQINA